MAESYNHIGEGRYMYYLLQECAVT